MYDNDIDPGEYATCDIITLDDGDHKCAQHGYECSSIGDEL